MRERFYLDVSSIDPRIPGPADIHSDRHHTSEIFSIPERKIFDRLFLASSHAQAYGRARVQVTLYCCERADVAQLVEQRIRNA